MFETKKITTERARIPQTVFSKLLVTIISR